MFNFTFDMKHRWHNYILYEIVDAWNVKKKIGVFHVCVWKVHEISTYPHYIYKYQACFYYILIILSRLYSTHSTCVRVGIDYRKSSSFTAIWMWCWMLYVLLIKFNDYFSHQKQNKQPQKAQTFDVYIKNTYEHMQHIHLTFYWLFSART